MLEVTRKLIDLLDVAPMGDDQFIGESEDLGFANVFGGQVLGQSLMAASKTVEGRLAHSLHGYFLRPGNPHRAIQYEVQRVRDGGSFSVRRVIARQDGKEIMTAAASFQQDEAGLDHQQPMPAAPDVAGLVSELELRRKLQHLMPDKVRSQLTQERAIEIRPVNPVNPLKPDVREPVKQNWFRVQGELPDDPVLHRCLLVYASDFGLLGTSLYPHAVTFADPRMRVASLDHAIWFERDIRVDQWLLYDMDSPSAAGGRGLNRGNIFNQQGVLIASVCQEALIRRR